MFKSNISHNDNIIFIDIDDTICDTRKAFGELYTEITGKPIQPMNSKRYKDMCPDWGEEEITIIFKNGGEVYRKAQPVPGAKEAIAKLQQKGFKIKLVSLNFADSAWAKQKWINKYFPELKEDLIILTSMKANKDIFKGYAIIDDDYKNIKTNGSRFPILLDMYNVYDDLNYGDKHHSWKEIVDKF